MGIPSTRSELDFNKLNTEFQTNTGNSQTKLSDFYGKTNDLPKSGEIKYSDFFGVDFLPEPPSGVTIYTDWQFKAEESSWVDNGEVSGKGKLLINAVAEVKGETISYRRFQIVVVGETGDEWSLNENYTESYTYVRYSEGDFTASNGLSYNAWRKSTSSGGTYTRVDTPVTEYVTTSNVSSFGYSWDGETYDDGYMVYTYSGAENYPSPLYRKETESNFKERNLTTGSGIGDTEAVTTSNAANFNYWQGYSGQKYTLTTETDENGYRKWIVADTQGEFWSLGIDAGIPLTTKTPGTSETPITPLNASANGWVMGDYDERSYRQWTSTDNTVYWERDLKFHNREKWTASGSNIFPATNSFTPQDNPGNNYWKDSKYKSYMKTSFTATSNLGNTKTVLFENGDQSWNSNKPLQNDTPQMSPLPSTYARGTVFKYRVDWTWEDYSGGKWLHIRIDDIFYLDHPAYNGTISGDNIKRYIDLTLSDIVNKSFSHAGLTIENYTPSNPSHVKDVTSITFKYQGYRIKVERAELHQSLLSYSVHALKYVPAYGDSEFTIDRLNTPNDAVNTKGHFTFSRGDWKYDKPPDLNRTYNNMMFSFWYNEEFITWDARPRDTNAIWISWWSVVNYKQLGYPHANGTDWAVVKLTPQQIQDGTWVTGNYGEQWRCLDYWTQSIGGEGKRNRYNPYYSATTQAADFPTIITHLKIEYQSNNGNIYRYWFKKGNNNLVGDVSGYYSVARWNAGLITRYDEGEAYYALNYEYFDYDYTEVTVTATESTWNYTPITDFTSSATSYYIYENVELTRIVTTYEFTPSGTVYYSQGTNPATALQTRSGQGSTPSESVLLTTSNYRDDALQGYNIRKIGGDAGIMQIYTGEERPFVTSTSFGQPNYWKMEVLTDSTYAYTIMVDAVLLIETVIWPYVITNYTHTDGRTFHRGTYQPNIGNSNVDYYFAVRADGFLTDHDLYEGGYPYDKLCIPTGQQGALYTYDADDQPDMYSPNPIRGDNVYFSTIAEGDTYDFARHEDTKVIRTPLEYVPYTPLFTHSDAKYYWYRQFTVADGDAFEEDETLPKWEVNASASYNWLENLTILNYKLYTVRKNTETVAGPLISTESVTASLADNHTYVTEVNNAQRINFSIDPPSDDTTSSQIVCYKLVKNQRRVDGDTQVDETVNLGYIYPEANTFFQYNGTDKIFVVVADPNGSYRLIWRCYQKTKLSILGMTADKYGEWGKSSNVQFDGSIATLINGGLSCNIFFGDIDKNKIGIDIWLEKRIIHTPANETQDTWAVCKCFDIFKYPLGAAVTQSQSNSDFLDIFNADI